MDGIKITVTGNIARVTEKPKYITSGTVGLPVAFTFDSQWDGLRKTAVFQAGYVSKIMGLLDGATVVPWEVLEKPNRWLSIGIYGVDEDGSEALPTIWVNVSVVQPGANPEGGTGTQDSEVAQRYYEASVLGAERAEIAAKNAENASNRAGAAADALEGGFVLKKGEGVDSVVQVITTESGNPDLDNKPIATGEGAMALGKFCVVEGHNSHAVNYYNRITASRAFAANENNEVHGYCGAAFGAANVITEEAQRAAVFGAQNTVSGPYAIGAGRYNKVSGENAFGCGQSTEAQALNSFACGKDTVAGARETFAGGNGSQALKQFDFAFGTGAIANGGAALAVGSKVQALAAYAWVGGLDSIVKGQAMAWGRGLLSNGGWQAVFGKFNVANNNALLVIGNGTADDARSNAFMVLDNAIVVGGQTLTAETIGNIATKAYIEEYINSLGVAEGAEF